MNTLVDPQDLVGVSEIAETLLTSKQVVNSWRERYNSFPKPKRVFSMGPIYSMKEVMYWHQNVHEQLPWVVGRRKSRERRSLVSSNLQ